MQLLYILFGLILLLILCSFAIPFYKNSKKNHFLFFSFSIFILAFTFILYQFSGNKILLKNWLSQGAEHYQLQTQVKELGGIEGIIKQVQKKIDANPEDPQGWFILGKLYLGIHDEKSAKVALKKAHELDPENSEIERVYQGSLSK